MKVAYFLVRRWDHQISSRSSYVLQQIDSVGNTYPPTYVNIWITFTNDNS